MSAEDCALPSKDWCIVDNHGQKYRLPKTMIFMGHEECDFVIQSNSVDKRHAVVTFDHYVNKFKIKDLSTIHGTFINDQRIPEQEYVTLEEHDSIRLGYAPLLYHIEQMDKGSPDIEDDLNPSGKIAIWPSEELLKIAELEASFKKDNQLPPKNFEDHTNLPQTYNEDGYNGHALDDPNHTWPRKQRPKSWTSPSTYSAQSPECVEERKRSSYHLESNVDMEHNYFDSVSPSLMKSSHSAMMDMPNVSDSASESRSNYVSMDNIPAYQRMPDAASRDSHIAKPPPSQSQSADASGGKNSCDNNNYRSRNELTTVKKGTPLYGQPAWWGEPDDVEDDPAISNKKSCAYEKTDHGSCKLSSKSGTVLGIAASDISQRLENFNNDPKYPCTYMEISYKDIESENIIACRGSLSSSISKDSLISPDSRKGSLEIISDIGKKQSSSERELSVEKSEPVNKVVDGGGTAFTVELGDLKPRKWNASGSLSEFMPSKIRRSFRERALKQSTKDGTPPKTVAEGDSPDGKTEEVEFAPEKNKTKNSKSNHSSEEDEIHVKTKKEKDISPGVKNGNVPFPHSKAANHHNDSEEHTPPACSGAASFLINKMFQGTSSGMSSGTNSNIGFEDQEIEQDLYSEAREYSKKIFQESQSPESKDLIVEKSTEDQPLEIVEDKVSEAGTYTIEGDVEAKEEEMARKRIDNVFGIGQDLQRPVINAETNSLDKNGTETSPNENLSPEYLKSFVNNTCLEETPEKNSVDDEKNISPDTTQTPISDTTVQSSGKTSVDMDYRPHSESAGSSPLISKPPIGSARKRAGTGRKLPSLPPDNNSSPSSTSSKSQQQIVSTPSSKKNEKWIVADISKKPKNLTSSTHGTKNQRTKLDSENDTNILLKNTEMAMAALEARVTSNNLAGTDDSESDISSSTNHREGVFRSRNRSTGERPGSRKSSFSDSSKVSSKSFLSSKERNPQVQRNYSKGSEKGSVSSDVTSESEALETLSNTSDFSLDCVSDSEGFNRHGSKGKGGISMTRPNRAFQLRQAKARGTEATDKLPPHSGGSSLHMPSVVSKSSAGKVKRVNSITLPTEKQIDSRRITSSSGSDSIHKTTESLKIGSNSNFMRTDGGRYSLRATRSASTSSATKPTDHRSRTDSKLSKPQLKSAHSTPGLNIVSLTNKSLSQPVSRSNSPRSSSDKNSSKKRKEFSQRKQKSSSANIPSAAPTESKTSKSQSHADSSKMPANSRMVRSASLELSKYKNSEVTTDKSSSKSYKDVSSLGEDSIKYGFVPYSGYKTSQSYLRHEQEEFDFGDEETLQHPKSIQAVCKGSLAGFSCQSAFVPAPKRKPHDTLQSTLNHLQSSCINSSSLKKKRELVNLRQSCDRIIVSSIYRLSVKLKTATDRTVQRLRESNKASPMPFLTDDFMDQDSGEMPAWTSANRELAAILCNLRHIEHRIRVIDQALFPEKEGGLEVDGLSRQRREKEKKIYYLQEIERIRTEIAGFQPIDNPEDKLWKDDERKMEGSLNYSGEEELF